MKTSNLRLIDQLEKDMTEQNFTEKFPARTSFRHYKFVSKVSIEVLFPKSVFQSQRSRKCFFLKYLEICWFYANFC